MLTQLLFSLGILALGLVFVHFMLVRPLKRFFTDEVVTSLTAIKDSIDRNTQAMLSHHPGSISFPNGNSSHSLNKGA